MPEAPAQGRWTPERIAEFEAACDARQLRRENPKPGPIKFESAVEVARHALVTFASEPGGALACDAQLAATTVVQALQGAGLTFNLTQPA